MFGLNVTLTMRPGKGREFLARVAACGVQEEIRREEGCLQYDLFLSAENGDRLLLMEKWVDREAQQLHLTQPHMEKWKAAKEGCVEATAIETYQLD